jgi:hypothetical protein
VIRALAGLVALLAYVLPGERVLEQMAAQRASAPALRVEARLDGIGESWPQRVVLELHPRFGCRVSGGAGERWLLRDGRVQAGSSLPAPPWLPELDVLIVPDKAGLARMLGELGIDTSISELARCGDRDCFVLGGRSGAAQLWLDKDSFEVVELRLADHRRVEFSAPRAGSGARFPGEIRINDEWGKIATLSTEAAGAAKDLRAEDFSPRWVEHAPAASSP